MGISLAQRPKWISFEKGTGERPKGGRRPMGLLTNCVDCAEELWIRPYRLQEGKQYRCKRCFNKAFGPPLVIKWGTGRREGAKMSCAHHWDIDRENRGTCLQCGEIRQFPRQPGDEVRLLKPGASKSPAAVALGQKEGRLRERENSPVGKGTASLVCERPPVGEGSRGSPIPPSKFTKQERDDIVLEALQDGVLAAARRHNLPNSTVGTWVSRWKKKRLPKDNRPQAVGRPRDNHATLAEQAKLVEEGERIGFTELASQTGIPRATLTTWQYRLRKEREMKNRKGLADEGHETDKPPRHSTKPKFTQEEKRSISEEALKGGVASASRRHDIPRSTISNWVEKINKPRGNVPDASKKPDLPTLPEPGGAMRTDQEIQVYLEALDHLYLLVGDRFSTQDGILPYLDGEIAALRWVLGERNGSRTDAKQKVGSHGR